MAKDLEVCKEVIRIAAEDQYLTAVCYTAQNWVKIYRGEVGSWILSVKIKQED